MLRKVPLVTVDGEDKIQVNGSSKFKVHVNGKPNNMMSNNPTEVLRSMPANAIKSIEVITEPGLNMTRKGGGHLEYYHCRSRNGRLYSHFEWWYRNMRVYGGGYGTVQSGDSLLPVIILITTRGSQKGFEDSYRGFHVSENKFLESHRRSKSYGNFQFGSLEGSYEIEHFESD